MNNVKLGLLLGIVAPIFAMITIYLIRFDEQNVMDVVNLLVQKGVFTKIVSLCVIPNLALFFLFLNKNYYYSARGVLLATILFAAFVFITKFAL